MKLEASKSSRYLGKPNLPNGVIKNDLEHILFLRKPGGYRSPTKEQEQRSRIETDDYVHYFAPIWTDVSGQLRTDHPAPYPLEIPRRLIRMFSFVGDTVVDPFCGTGSTTLAAVELGRSSVAVEIDPNYVATTARRLAETSVTARVKILHRTETFVANVEDEYSTEGRQRVLSTG